MENLYVQNPKVPAEKTQGKLDVWFQKLSVPPSQKVFFLRPPPPTSLEIPVKLHTFTKIFGPLTTPHPPGISNPFRCGSMDIFWNYTM